MKKFWFFAIFCLSISIQTQSQALIALLFGKKINIPDLVVGIQLGGNLSFQTNSSYDDPRASFAFGAYSNFKFHPRWHLNTFMTFKSNRGMIGLDTSYTIYRPLDSTLQDVRFDRKLTYMDLNPEFQYAVTESFYIGIGPVISLLIKARDYYHNEGEKKTQNEYNIYKQMNLFDVGISVDLQYTFGKGEGLSINLKYIQGFLNPYKHGVNPPAMSSFLNLGVGIPMTGRGKKPEAPVP